MLHKKYLKKNIRTIFSILFLIFSLPEISCKKYLEQKPSQDLAIPSKISDLQALLDGESLLGSCPGYKEFITDNLYLSSSNWSSSNLNDRLNYIWDKDARTAISSTWGNAYETIYKANFVLDFLPKINISESEKDAYDNVKGIALFYRSFMFHQLAQLFCQSYSANAETDLGLVLRTTSEVLAPVTRATVKQTYEQIINDLKIAAELLPIHAIINTRPNKAAAYGALARVYLSMRDYTQAAFFANACLQLSNMLLDYVNLTGFPDARSNPEILYIDYEGSRPSAWSSCNIDTLLYQQYSGNDRRRQLFFEVNGSDHFWKGSYASNFGSFQVFTGIANDEIYLIRAECAARAGNKDQAMNDLNTLLLNRISGYTNLSAATSAEALDIILKERRKELVARGLRWSDLRRFNLEGANITLKRTIYGTTYTLPPNDLRWVLLIPDDEINRSGIVQNPR